MTNDKQKKSYTQFEDEVLGMLAGKCFIEIFG